MKGHPGFPINGMQTEDSRKLISENSIDNTHAHNLSYASYSHHP
jgi:hypothetical protein